MIDNVMTSQNDSSQTVESNSHAKLTASKQKQPQSSYSPHEYSTPVTTTNQQVIKCNEQLGHGDWADACTATIKENTYQPLIPPRSVANSDPNEYQTLTQHTLPKKLNLPPAIPPKPRVGHNT